MPTQPSWTVNIGATTRDTKVFYGDLQIGRVQNVQISIDANEVTPVMTLKIIDPHVQINGAIENTIILDKDNHTLTVNGVVCPDCKEVRNIESKDW